MDLLSVLAGLVWLQGWVWVPSGGVLVASLGWKNLHVAGPGYRWSSPWPGSRALVLSHVPVTTTETDVVTDAPLRRIGGHLGRTPRRIAIADAAHSHAEGHHVEVSGTRLLSAASPQQAARLATELRGLAAGEPLSDWISRSFDAERYQERFEDARRTTRWLRWCCNLTVLSVFLAVPAIAIWGGAETSWILLGPGLLALHGLSVLLLGLCYRQTESRPVDWGARFFSAVAYPPALWRESTRLVADAVAGFDPLCALAWESDERRLRELRRALATIEHSGRWQEAAEWMGAGSAALEARRSAILELAEKLDVAVDSLRASPAGEPAADARYCPVCRDEYRSGYPFCADCEAGTLPWGEAALASKPERSARSDQ